MKKLFLFSLLLTASISKGQITLENFYNNTPIFSFVRLSLTDDKWAVIDTSTITLYNANHSLYKTISIVNAPVNPFDVLFISKALFDTDSTTIEYMVDYSDGTYPTGSGVNIYREDGTILFSEPSLSASFGFSVMTNPVRPAWYPIVITSDGPKMVLVAGYDTISFTPNAYKVYSLPGVYYPSLVFNLHQVDNQMELSNPFPNPSSNLVQIKYTIPETEKNAEIIFYRINGTEAKRFKVDNRFDTLELNSSDLPAGTYFYYMINRNHQSSSKKMIIIK